MPPVPDGVYRLTVHIAGGGSCETEIVGKLQDAMDLSDEFAYAGYLFECENGRWIKYPPSSIIKIEIMKV